MPCLPSTPDTGGLPHFCPAVVALCMCKESRVCEDRCRHGQESRGVRELLLFRRVGRCSLRWRFFTGAHRVQPPTADKPAAIFHTSPQKKVFYLSPSCCCFWRFCRLKVIIYSASKKPSRFLFSDYQTTGPRPLQRAVTPGCHQYCGLSNSPRTREFSWSASRSLVW